MAGGLFALLDDIAVIAKQAAAGLDDVAAGAAKASAKSAGVIIDDTAVTPGYIIGVTADRELGIIKRIAFGSFRNKFLIIIPLALVLSQFAEWALPILLVAGGTFLAFEGAEKVMGWLGLGHHQELPAELAPHANNEARDASEDKLVFGAVRTDLILSTEIMLIALSNIETDSFWTRLGILLLVGVGMTVGVYGAVALLIRMDDLGIALAQRPQAFFKRFGAGLVSFMPKLLSIISVIGTLAMLWVGGHLLVVNLDELGFTPLYDFLHHILHEVESAGGVVHWLVDTIYSAIVGLAFGLVVVLVLTGISKLMKRS